MTFLHKLAPAVLPLALAACGAAPQTAVVSETSDAPMYWETETLAGERGAVDVYNAAAVLTIPNPINRGIKVLHDGQPTLSATIAPLLVTKAAKAASANLMATRDYYAATFGRDSYDGQGSVIRAAVDVQRYHLVPILGMKENAAWMEPFKHFVFGAGGAELGGFADAIDVVAHEFTHAVVGATSKLVYEGQSGALNEHLADVFGEIVQHAQHPDSEPFLIGETTLRGPFAEQARALRDMLSPAQGLSKQPGHLRDIPEEFGASCTPTSTNDNCGVHTLSGIPNRAAALTIQAIGWEKAAPLFYVVMTERLHDRSDFADYRAQVVAECDATLSATECAAVEAAFADVGL